MANQYLPPEPDDHQLSSLARHIRPIFGEYYGDPALVRPGGGQAQTRAPSSSCGEILVDTEAMDIVDPNCRSPRERH
ncbi:hypothetical protein GCM10023108_30060 [Saccharopolyspora hordei]